MKTNEQVQRHVLADLKWDATVKAAQLGGGARHENVPVVELAASATEQHASNPPPGASTD